MKNYKVFAVLGVCAVALVMLCSVMESFFHEEETGIISRENIRASWNSAGEFVLRDFSIESVKMDDTDKFVFVGNFENTSEKEINLMANAVTLYDKSGNQYGVSVKGAAVISEQGKDGFSSSTVGANSQLKTYMVFDAPADVEADRVEICYNWMNKENLIIKLDKY